MTLQARAQRLVEQWREKAASNGAIYAQGITECADELAALLASPEEAGSSCVGCASGWPILLLDANGVQSAISGQPGTPSHAVDDFWFPCSTQASPEEERSGWQPTGEISAKPFSAWHEDFGDVLWWHFPIQESPYVGSPLASDWPFESDDEARIGWTPLACPKAPPVAEAQP